MHNANTSMGQVFHGRKIEFRLTSHPLRQRSNTINKPVNVLVIRLSVYENRTSTGYINGETSTVYPSCYFCFTAETKRTAGQISTIQGIRKPRLKRRNKKLLKSSSNITLKYPCYRLQDTNCSSQRLQLRCVDF